MREVGLGEAREAWIDLVRIVAVVLVISVHVTTGYFERNADYFAANPDWLHSLDWIFSCLVASLSRICVPLFFMISGYLLLRPGVDPTTFYSRRLTRILIPFVVWSVIYIAVRICWHGNQISFLSAVRLFYNGDVFYHLWFIYALIGVYLAIPLLSPLAETGRTRSLYLFVILSFLFGSLFPIIDRVAADLSGYAVHLGIPIGIFWMYAGYAVLGVLAGQSNSSRRLLLLAVAGFLIGVSMTFGLTWVEARALDAPSQDWFGYSQPWVVMTSVAAFLIFRSVRISANAAKTLRYLSGLSFGIYLAHPLIMESFSKLGFVSPATALIGIPLMIVLVFLGSTALIAFLDQMPVVKKAVG